MMDLATIVADAGYAVTLAKLAYQAGQDIAPFLENAYQLLVQKVALTDEQRAKMIADEAALRAVINADTLPQDQP